MSTSIRHEFFIGFQNSHMRPPEALIAETIRSFSGLTKSTTEVIERRPYRFEKSLSYTAKTINNYLKTPEEMDAEFCLEMNTKRMMNKEYTSMYNTYRRMIENEDGNTNTYSPDDTPSGFMEENY
jgi:hypothetical protein